MPMPPGYAPMDSPLNGIDFNIMQISVVPQTVNSITTIPSSLTTNITYFQNQANTNRTVRFTADSLMVMDGPFYFNGNSFDMMRVDYEIPLNNIPNANQQLQEPPDSLLEALRVFYLGVVAGTVLESFRLASQRNCAMGKTFRFLPMAVWYSRQSLLPIFF